MGGGTPRFLIWYRVLIQGLGLVNRTQFAIVPSALKTWATADPQFRYLFGQLLLRKFPEVYCAVFSVAFWNKWFQQRVCVYVVSCSSSLTVCQATPQSLVALAASWEPTLRRAGTWPLGENTFVRATPKFHGKPWFRYVCSLAIRIWYLLCPSQKLSHANRCGSKIRVKSEEEDWFASVIALVHVSEQAAMQGRSHVMC